MRLVVRNCTALHSRVWAIACVWMVSWTAVMRAAVRSPCSACVRNWSACMGNWSACMGHWSTSMRNWTACMRSRMTGALTSYVSSTAMTTDYLPVDIEVRLMSRTTRGMLSRMFLYMRAAGAYVRRCSSGRTT